MPGPSVLAEAAEFELELSSDGFWPDQPDERIVKRDNIIRAARLVDAWQAGSCTHHQVAKLAGAAAVAQDVGGWPSTLDEADDLIPRAVLARELLLLRDVLRVVQPRRRRGRAVPLRYERIA